MGEALAQGWRAIARGMRGAYDFAGTNMLISSIWFFLGFFPAMLTFLVFVQVPALNSLLIFGIVAATLLGPLTAGVYSICDALLQGEDVTIREYFSHFRRHYTKALASTAVMGAILALLVLDVLFFGQLGTRLGQVISVFWMYMIFVWCLTIQFVYPLIVRRDLTVWQTLKTAVLLALDNTVATLVITLVALAVAAVSYFLRFPLMLFMAGTLGFLHCAALDELLVRYKRARDEVESAKENTTHD